MQSIVEQELRRLRALMSEERTRTKLTEVTPDKPADAIGALAAVGYLAKDPEVRAAVYVFEKAGSQAAVVEKLKAGVPAGSTRVLHGTNGRMLFFGWTRTDGPDGKKASFRLADLISAFSGDE